MIPLPLKQIFYTSRLNLKMTIIEGIVVHPPRINQPNITMHPPQPPHNPNELRSSLLAIPVKWAPPHTTDTDNNPPPLHEKETYLTNLYTAYLEDPSPQTPQTLVWINLLRGILNQASWLPCWIHLMSNSYLSSLTNQNHHSTLLNLQMKNVFMVPPPKKLQNQPSYNWFPLYPNNPPEPRTPPLENPNLLKLDLPLDGTTLKLEGKLNHAAMMILPLTLAELDICVSCSIDKSCGLLTYLVNLYPTFIMDPTTFKMSMPHQKMPSMQHFNPFAPSTSNTMHVNTNLSLSLPNLDTNYMSNSMSSHPSNNPPFISYPKLNIFSWNVRGAGSREFLRTIKNLVFEHQPDVIILTETRLSGDRAKMIISKIGYDKFYKVDAMGFAGGLWLLWNPLTISLNIIGSSFQEIHSHAKVNNLPPFLFTALYASPIHERRKNLWNSLSSFATSLSMPWLIMGDFNDISNPNEKFGGSRANYYKMNCFNNFLLSSKLLDLGFEGPKFTWSNGRQNGHLIRTRIDRSHANNEWSSLFPNCKVFHLPRTHSDHCPLLLKTSPSYLQGEKPFRLEYFWLTHNSFIPLVSNIWNLFPNDLDKTVSIFQEKVKAWSKVTFNNIFLQKRTLSKRLLGIQKALSLNSNPQLLKLEQDLLNNFNTILDQEEALWQAKSRINWLTLGDRNTSFFHKSTIIRRRNNNISSIEDNLGTTSYDPYIIKSIIYDFFKISYTKTSPPPVYFTLPHLKKLPSTNASHLLIPPSSFEIKNTIFSLNPFKAPGSDGLNAFFYQKTWLSQVFKLLIK